MKDGSLACLRGVKKNGEGVRKMRDVISVPETRPEPGGTHKVNIDIIMGEPTETMGIGLGGVHWQAREELCIKGVMHLL